MWKHSIWKLISRTAFFPTAGRSGVLSKPPPIEENTGRETHPPLGANLKGFSAHWRCIESDTLTSPDRNNEGGWDMLYFLDSGRGGGDYMYA